MKMRTTCLPLLAAVSWPLLFCARLPSENLAAPNTPTVGGVGSPGSALASAVVAKNQSALSPAVFPHEKHATELGIACTQCHHETNAKPLSVPHPEYFHDFWIDCSICHRKKGEAPLEPQACSTCHHPQNGNIADETLSAKVVIHKNCWSCHEVGVGASASATCKTCHKAGS